MTSGELSVGLLGEPELRVNGQVLPELGGKLRLLLTTLALRVGQVVSTEELVERLWGEAAPSSARTTVRSHVMRLRKVLSLVGAGSLVEAAGGGYRLRIDPSVVDAHRFRQLVGLSRREDDKYRALMLTEQALALWRGKALAGLDQPWAEAARHALEQERFAAENDRFDLALACGRHNSVLAALFERTATYPLDERAAGQLMLALYRCGRTADALAHFHQIQSRVVDKLGTDPDPALRRLHQQILTEDVALAAPSAPPVGAAPVEAVPRQLPLPPKHLVGRIEELAELDRVGCEQSKDVRFSVIVGTGGMGKTSLALYWAHLRVDRFPDGQLFVDLRGFSTAEPMSVSTVVCGFLDALGVDAARIPANIEAQTALYRSVVAGRRMLIVLDNARDSDQVVPLLPGTSTCTILVTSRNRLSRLIATHSAHPIVVDVLSTAEARQVLVERLGDARLAAEPDAVANLLFHCAGFPLALSVLAGRVQSAPRSGLTALADELREETTRLAALDDQDPSAALPGILSWSYAALTVDQARLFALLGLIPGPDIDVAAAANLADLSPSLTRSSLRGLADSHLVRPGGSGRYRMHDLVKLYAADRAEHVVSPEGRDSALRRLADFYLHTAHTAERLLEPHREPIPLIEPSPGCQTLPLSDFVSAQAWFRAEQPALLAVQRLAADRGWHTHVWQLAWVADTFHWRQGGHHHDALVMWQAGLLAASALGDTAVETRAHRCLGQAYTLAGHPREAAQQLSSAVDLAVRMGDVLAEAHAHRSLVRAWDRQGDAAMALSHATRALCLFQAVGGQAQEADMLNAVGWFHARLGSYEQGRIHCEAALELARRHQHRVVEAGTLDSLGYVAHHTGRHVTAVDYYLRALDLYRDLGHADGEAETLEDLGHIYRALHQYSRARASWQQAADLRHLHHRADIFQRIHQLMNDLDEDSVRQPTGR